MSQGKISLDGDVMSVPELGRTFRLESAVYVQKLIDGEDRFNLLERVKTHSQLQKLNAEHYGTSLIIQDVGYECAEGFVGAPEGSLAGGLEKLES